MIKDGFNEPNKYLQCVIYIYMIILRSLLLLNEVQHKYFQLIFKSY